MSTLYSQRRNRTAAAAPAALRISQDIVDPRQTPRNANHGRDELLATTAQC